jgi:TRAP-type uncharacterized transport system substrate-binding protein
MRPRIDRQFFRTRTGVILIIVTAGVLLWALFAALRPFPSRDIAMATGPAGSAYARMADRYRGILARDGVRLRLVPTNGAVDNARLLEDPRSGVGVGFVQAGSVDEKAARNVESLGTVFYEAVWIFCHCSDAHWLQRPGVRLSIAMRTQ